MTRAPPAKTLRDALYLSVILGWRGLSLWMLVAALGCERTSEGATPNAAVSAVRPTASVASATLESPPAPPDTLTYRRPLPAEPGDNVPAKRYAAISRATCSVTLRERALPFSPAKGRTPGVENPLKLTGPVNGVRFELPKSAYGFVDCRLALLMDDLAMEFAALGVEAVTVNNSYRPGSHIQGKVFTKPTGKRAARRAAKSGLKLSQHARALALDITEFRLKDGQVLNVERDFHGTRGAPPCGPESRVDSEDPAATKLRNITCALARGAYCNHLITPNRDDAHANHLHCDIEEKAREIAVY